MSLPPCGCRTGCEHMRNPQFPAQRECRAGIMPTGRLADGTEYLAACGSPPVLPTSEQTARARWASWRALRTVAGEFES